MNSPTSVFDTADGRHPALPHSNAGRCDAVVLTAVMPCLNEERTVGVCIGKAFAAFQRMGLRGEVVVADNGSSDQSAALAAALGARVVPVAVRGYGAALTAGIVAARGEYIVMADADDSYDWLQLEPFVNALAAGCDLVIGNRFLGGIDRGAMPGLNRYVGNPVLSWLARTIHRAPVGDFHCGMRAFRREAFLKMRVRTSGMEFATEMIVNAVQAGLKISEVPTRLQRDGRDRRPHLRPFRDGWRHLRFILTYGPNYLYLAPGIGLFSIGILLVVLLAAGPISIAGYYVGIHFLALACALTLVGFNIIHYGILAKVVALRRMPQQNSRLGHWVLKAFSLEATLLAGACLIVAGLAADASLLIHWVRSRGGPMNTTVHAVFVASLAIVLGVNLSLGGFLLHMLIGEQRDETL